MLQRRKNFKSLCMHLEISKTIVSAHIINNFPIGDEHDDDDVHSELSNIKKNYYSNYVKVGKRKKSIYCMGSTDYLSSLLIGLKNVEFRFYFFFNTKNRKVKQKKENLVSKSYLVYRIFYVIACIYFKHSQTIKL